MKVDLKECIEVASASVVPKAAVVLPSQKRPIFKMDGSSGTTKGKMVQDRTKTMSFTLSKDSSISSAGMKASTSTMWFRHRMFPLHMEL